ncbi:hypothetical protein K469DRAFT_682838 [Zopfia rhizophila CBS 207.26]|uniref:Uncharacterized protein n=1 Tax=Zopfia rhizophila CBS 207.26 TaxID=1314779 RepID=A0A6A6DDJ2_9PEZI|nr:hypothetical protein K469DRAFT_682838 [Zopfia rhizophila CBS 207.26]
MAMRYSKAKLDWKPNKITLSLLDAWRLDRFKYDATAFEDYVEQMVRFFSTAEILTEEEARNIFEVNNDDRPPKRCGIPEPKDHRQDKLSLFLDKLHDTNEQQYPEITYFFVHRSVYFAFLGKPARIINHGTTHGQTRSPEQEILDVEDEEETQGFSEQQRFAQLAEQRGERQRQAEQERKKQRQTEERQLAQLSERRQTEQELFEEDDIQETHTSKGRKYLKKAQPDRGSLASLWNLDRERPYRKKPKPPRGIDAARRENDRKQTTQINLGKVIEPISQEQVELVKGE